MQATLLSVPVFDHVEIVAEYTDGTIVTVPDVVAVVATTCPNCSTIVLLAEPVDSVALPVAWVPIRDPKVLAGELEALNCDNTRSSLLWHLTCIRMINARCRLSGKRINADQSPEWSYLNSWVADERNLEYSSDAADIAEAYRRLGKFTECLRCLELGSVVDRSRAKRIEQLAIAGDSALGVV